MPAPSLRIPVGLNMAEFEKNVDSAKNHTRQATQFILKQFADMNASLGGPMAAGLAAGYGAAALRMVGVFGLVVTAAKQVGDVIQATRDRLVEMVEVADKAGSRGLTAEFFQSFVSGAKGAEDRITLFEDALTRAWQATKPLLNPDWTVWDTGLTKVSAVEKAMRDTRELFTTDQNFSGFDLFKNAQSQDEKVRAVLVYMKQLKDIGQDVAALDIGEKMFGSKFIDDIRLGRESVEGMLRTIDAGSKTSFISNESAKNAKELDDRLNDAYRTISERMKPSWDDLADVALRIKGIWTNIIEAVAAYHAAEKTGGVVPPGLSDADARNNPDPNSPAFANPVLLNQGRRRRGQLPDTSPAPAVPSQAAGLDAYSSLNDLSGKPPAPEAIPMPRRRPIDAPKPPAADEANDAYDRAIEQIEKHTARTQADAETVGKGAAAQAQMRAELQLNAAAKSADIEITDKERAKIDELSKAAGAAAEQLARAKVASEADFNLKTAFLTQDDLAIARQLAGIYGNDIPTALASSEAAAIRLTTGLRSISDIGQDINRGLFTEFGQNIRNHQNAFEALGNSGISALGKIGDKLASMAADGLWKAAFGGMSGSSILSLFGLGDGDISGGSSANPLAGLDASDYGIGYDSGGYTGPGARKQPAGVVHKGEIVWNQDDIQRNGGVGAVEAMRRGQRGYDDGGYVGGMMPAPIAGRGGASAAPQFTYAPNIDARGVDAKQLGTLAGVVAKDRREFVQNVKAIMASTKRNNPGFA